jgi:AraC family transcriptional regulator of adaptative response/methylated-DNA-[protein]-cysteine methyltransferase
LPDDEKEALQQLQLQFPNAQFRQVVDTIQQNALFIFTQDWKDLSKIKLHLKGNSFSNKSMGSLIENSNG